MLVVVIPPVVIVTEGAEFAAERKMLEAVERGPNNEIPAELDNVKSMVPAVVAAGLMENVVVFRTAVIVVAEDDDKTPVPVVPNLVKIIPALIPAVDETSTVFLFD